jgi:hypothetical protein
MKVSLRRAAAVSAASLLAMLPLASSASGAAAHTQRRQLAVTTLSSFEVVLTATRKPDLRATVTAAGYRKTSRGWMLIATRQVGVAGRWFWFSTTVCSLTVTQLKPLPSSATNSDTMTVSLLETPALGCSKAYTKHWKP